MIIDHNLNDLFVDALNDLSCRNDTKSYIIGIFNKYKYARDDYSQHSITILYGEAKASHNFSKYQNLADWLLYAKSFFPKSLNNASEEYYNNIAQISYYYCYKTIKTWEVYKDLCYNYCTLTKEINQKLFG